MPGKNGVTQEAIKSFAEYGNEPEFDTVSDKKPSIFMLEVAGYSLFDADNGTHLVLNTRVAGGEHEGKLGPSKFLDPNGHSFVVKGREVTISQEKARKDFYYTATHIHNDEVLQLATTDFSDDMLEELGNLLEGDVFLAKVSIGDNGRDKLGAIYPLSSPPKGYKVPVDTEGVTI